MLADGIEFFIGQGCKVGVGGHLMGQKVTEQVAEMRSLPAGIDQRSPRAIRTGLGPRRPLAEGSRRPARPPTTRSRFSFKLGAARVYDDVRMAAKCGPTSSISTVPRRHGAGPHIAAEETGIPLLAAIPEARRALEDVGLSDDVGPGRSPAAFATAATSRSASPRRRRRSRSVTRR
jgi:glutamate synthase domain-containing protein 2